MEIENEDFTTIAERADHDIAHGASSFERIKLAVDEARILEREACAAIADGWEADVVARAIRARGAK